MVNIADKDGQEEKGPNSEDKGREDASGGGGQARPLRWFVLPAVFLALCLAAGLLYCSTMQMPFTFDDVQNIRENPRMRLEGFSPGEIYRAAIDHPNKNRFVSNLSFALNYKVHGWNLWGFHAVNIAFHALAGIFLFLFIRATFATPYGRTLKGPPVLIAFLAALVWLAHPIQTQAVSYIVQRMTSMAGAFFVAASWAFVRARLAGSNPGRLAWASACLLFALLAIGSKENAVTLPVFLLVYEWFFFQNLSRRWLVKALPWLGGCFVVFVIAGLFYVGWDPAGYLEKTYAMRDFSLGERLLTQLRVVSFYISLLILPLPSRLNLLHDIPVSRSLVDPASTLAALFFLAALVAITVLATRKHRLLAFCGLWFFGNLVIESSFIPLELVFEHRLYLPSMMLALALVMGVYSLISNRKAALAVVMVAVAFFAWGTWERNKVWQDKFTLFEDVVKKSPENPRGLYAYASALVDEDQPEKALGYALKSVEIRPKDPKAHFAVARALEHPRMGRNKDAIEYFRKAVQLNPMEGPFWVRLGVALAHDGQAEEAVKSINAGLALAPDNPSVHLNAGRAFLALVRPEEALEVLEKALVLDRHYHLPHGNMGIAHAMMGNTQKANEHFLAFMKHFPDDPLVYINLGRMLLTQGKPREAYGFLQKANELAPENRTLEQALEEAAQAVERLDNIERLLARLGSELERNPDDASLLDRMGNLHRMKGDFAGAVDYHNKALALAPGSPEIHNNLGLAHMATGDFEQARKMLEKALELDPESIPALYNLTSLHSRQEDFDMAREIFKQLLDAGFEDFDMIEKDPNMKNLRLTNCYRTARELNGAGATPAD
jgi:Flp pilus assembly protein TadD